MKIIKVLFFAWLVWLTFAVLRLDDGLNSAFKKVNATQEGIKRGLF